MYLVCLELAVCVASCLLQDCKQSRAQHQHEHCSMALRLSSSTTSQLAACSASVLYSFHSAAVCSQAYSWPVMRPVRLCMNRAGVAASIRFSSGSRLVAKPTITHTPTTRAA